MKTKMLFFLCLIFVTTGYTQKTGRVLNRQLPDDKIIAPQIRFTQTVTREMTTQIVRLKTTQGPNEGAPCNKIMDYKAEIQQGEGLDYPSLGLVTQAASTKSFGVIEGNNITPGWSLQSEFDGDQEFAMVTIKVWDNDDAICGGKDDVVDVAFATQQEYLRLWVELKSRRIYRVNIADDSQPLVPKYIVGNYVAMAGTNFSIRGNNSQDHAAEITVNINIETKIISGHYPTKSASLTLVLFDDTPFFNLVQNAQIAYGNCFEGYDKSVLLKRRYDGTRRPDRHLQNPSRATFFSELKALAEDGYYIDIFIFSHGFKDNISLLENQEEILAKHIIEELHENGGRFADGKFPIRLVYGVNCYGASLRGDWLKVGAKAVVGARRINFYPNQANKFISEWNKGNVNINTAYHWSNTTSSRTVMHLLIKAHATSASPCFRPKCNFGKTVLGTDSNDCAYRYFDCEWGLDYPKYQGDDGIDIMNHSSEMLFGGDNLMTKNKQYTW